MAKWIEGFKPGKHIDTAGITHTFTEVDCQELAGTYNPQLHEAPIVAGHPKHDAPAMGWVGAMRFNDETKRVEYTEENLLPEFTEMLTRKLFKKRSLALYDRADPRNPTPGKLHLRHVGYLGAMPPAIKGLQDRPAFKEADAGGCITFEFGDWNDRLIARMFRNIKNFLTGEFGQEKADRVLDEWDLQSLTEEAVKPDPAESPFQSSYHEEDQMKVEEVESIVAKAVAGVTQQFAELLKPVNEQMKVLGEQNAALTRQFAEGEDSAARREFTAFCEDLKTRIVPGEIPTLVDQMMNLRKAADVSFGEGDQKTTVSAVADFQAKLKGRAETVQFGEFAEKRHAGERSTGEADAMVLARKATEFQEAEGKAGRTVTLAQALLHVEKEMGGAK